jgi:hypothetical protein
MSRLGPPRENASINEPRENTCLLRRTCVQFRVMPSKKSKRTKETLLSNPDAPWYPKVVVEDAYGNRQIALENPSGYRRWKDSPASKAYDTRDVARHAKCGYRTVLRHVTKKLLVPCETGPDGFLFRKSEVDRWLSATEIKPGRPKTKTRGGGEEQ